MKWFAVMALMCLGFQPLYANDCGQPRPFVSDGCTHIFQRDPTTNASYMKCCFIHDVSYYIGGSNADKAAADQDFASCVRKTITAVCSEGAGAIRAAVCKVKAAMHAATKEIAVAVVGDHSCGRDNDWEWGYGYSKHPNCACRTAPDRVAALAELKKQGIDPGSLEGWSDRQVAAWIKNNRSTVREKDMNKRGLTNELERLLRGAEGGGKGAVPEPAKD